MSIKKLVDDLLVSPTPKRLGEQKYTFAEMEKMAERDDFGAVLTAVGVPNTPFPGATPKKWSEGDEFDASKFVDTAYKKYQRDFFKK